MIISYSFGKSEIFIKLVKKFLVPTAYFKDFNRIFDEYIPRETKALFCMHPHAVFAYSTHLSI